MITWNVSHAKRLGNPSKQEANPSNVFFPFVLAKFSNIYYLFAFNSERAALVVRRQIAGLLLAAIVLNNLANRRSCCERKFSLPARPGSKTLLICNNNFGLSTGRSFVLRAPFNIIFTPVLLWYLHHRNVYDNFVCLFCYTKKLLYHYTCLFSHQNKLGRFHSFIVTGGIAFWHLRACGAISDHGVALGLTAWQSLVFDAWLT